LQLDAAGCSVCVLVISVVISTATIVAAATAVSTVAAASQRYRSRCYCAAPTWTPATHPNSYYRVNC
jgi:hypothetical protein